MKCNAVICQQELDVKLAKLEIKKLKLLTVHELSISDTDFSQNNIVHNFKKKIATKNSKLSFKLDDTNYDFWHDEVFVQILSIKIKNILNNREIICFSDLINNDVKIWKIKNKILFDMLFSSFKVFIHQIIKNQIDKD